jgi:Uma2 family endonuclease
MVLAKDINLPDTALATEWEPRSTEDWEEDSEDVIVPPSDLWSDEPPLESEWHLRQLLLLIQCLELWWGDRQDFYAFGNLTIYYSTRRLKSEMFRGPDFFVVLDTERKPRKSWVVWEEDGKYPNVIVEILSASTAQVDRVTKKQIYQETFRTPNYFWFNPYNPKEFKGFNLVNGQYEDIEPNAEGWLWSQQLGLYLGVQDSILRLFTPEGELIPTPEEARLQEYQRAEQERQRADRLEQRLRELGIDS